MVSAKKNRAGENHSTSGENGKILMDVSIIKLEGGDQEVVKPIVQNSKPTIMSLKKVVGQRIDQVAPGMELKSTNSIKLGEKYEEKYRLIGEKDNGMLEIQELRQKLNEIEEFITQRVNELHRNQCLPVNSIGIVENARQPERRKELEPKDKKSSKRKSEALDEVPSDENSVAKKIKQDYTNTIKHLKDQMKSNLKKLNQKIDSGYSKNNQERLASACYYCAKPNHRYTDCSSASPTEKDKISNLLREKKFDFIKLKERAKAFIKNRRQNTNTTALNPGSPTHSSF